MKSLLIVRGLPGSGKTTLANLIAEHVYSADDYFYDEAGNYNFDGSKIKDAHDYCRRGVESAMIYDRPTVAVANTFTQEWEMKPYFELAEKYGYTVHTIITENRHGSENVHNVPGDVITKMKDRFSIKLI